MKSIKGLFRFIVIGFVISLINPCLLLSQNLVPNNSFEVYDTCPYLEGQARFASGWFNPQSDTITSPDYFNSCSSWPFSTPFNGFGSQTPYHGFAYLGLALYVNINNLHDIREYVEIELLQTLIVGKQYYLELNVSFADRVGYGQNFIGLAFSDTLYVKPTYEYFNIPTAIEYNGPPLIDTVNWVTISGVYTATGTEQFILLGCFKPDSLLLLDSINVYYPGGGDGQESYYYFDNIKVIPLDSLQGIDEPISNLSVNVYPNPAKEWLTLDFNSKIQKQLNVSLISMDGKEIKSWSEKYTSKMYLTLPQLSNGFYFLKIRNGAGEVVRKVVVGE